MKLSFEGVSQPGVIYRYVLAQSPSETYNANPRTNKLGFPLHLLSVLTSPRYAGETTRGKLLGMAGDQSSGAPPLYLTVLSRIHAFHTLRCVPTIRHGPSLGYILGVFSPRTGWKSPASHDIRARFPSYQTKTKTYSSSRSEGRIMMKTIDRDALLVRTGTPAAVALLFPQKTPRQQMGVMDDGLRRMVGHVVWEAHDNAGQSGAQERQTPRPHTTSCKLYIPCLEAKTFVGCCRPAPAGVCMYICRADGSMME